jgi:hypothetical protein
MLFVSRDPSMHVLVALSSGTHDDAEFERIMSEVSDLDRMGSEQQHAIAFVLLLKQGDEPPNAHWRRRLADHRAGLRSPRVFASIVTESALVRGVLTAVNWIAPVPPGMK